MYQKAAILYSGLSGYTAACQAALKAQYVSELLVFHWPVAAEAPFAAEIFRPIDHAYDKSRHTRKEILQVLRQFQPQFILMAGWMERDYLYAAGAMRREGVPVIAGSDTQWNGSFRQRVGQLIARQYLHPAIDALWVSGERQRQLAWKLGFRGPRCLTGYYTCDWNLFAAEHPPSYAEAEKAFLFVGRYLPRKGLDLLLQAYREYRSRTEHPWRLITAGTGPLAGALAGVPGVEDMGFIQPSQLPALLRRAGAFILPSRKEPWGVALHEAAAAARPLICSDTCGAGVHLLQDGYNGYLHESGNVRHLASCLSRLSALAPEQWETMGRRSFELSKQFTPERWATTLAEGVANLPR